ncbi:MAG: HPF/RaiA family ribosome-associated protein [Mucinivorans sp.]
MKTQIQSVHFTADQKLLDFVDAKLQKLSLFDDTISWGEAILKLDKDPDQGNKVVLIKLVATGADLTAERRALSFEEATDEACDALRKQIEKRKK